MSRFVFLTQRMQFGWGVDLVLHEVARRLVGQGHAVSILCNEADSSYRGPYTITQLSGPDPHAILAHAEDFEPDAVIACTTPFFEVLPVLRHQFCCWAWEFGDPTPGLFPDDGEIRERIRRFKIEFCYPVLDGVLAISEFIRRDIEWPPARALHLGCEHAPDLGIKSLQDAALDRARPLRVGTLMRLGAGESNYKGNRLFLRLTESLRTQVEDLEICVMGRGSEEDAEEFRRAGFRVHLNASDQEKWRYLRELDVFVTCSLWEGFNLPLAEAQAVGTLGLAFDTGAHPEVSPLIFADLPEMADFIRELNDNRELLGRHSRAAYSFVRRTFSWDRTTARFLELVLSGAARRDRVAPRVAPSSVPEAAEGGAVPARLSLRRDLSATLRSLRFYGWRHTAEKVRWALRERFRR